HTLPKLPVPELQSTMDKYLSLVKTVVSPEEYARTQRIVADFCKPHGLGQQLQDYLLSRQQNTDNWATDWWLNDMYLNVRLPLIINSNPVAVFPYQRFPSRRHQVRITAKLICGMLDFKNLLDTRTLPIERCKNKEKGQPLCMEQHYRLFSSYRQPGHDVDVLRTNLHATGNEYIVVACNNQFYKVEVGTFGDPICEADLCLQLSRILNMAENNKQSPEVGVLTSQSRNDWAEHRDHLLEDETNRISLQTLENCLFLVCLDKATVPSFGCSRKDLVTDLTARTHHIIHGQGVRNNTCNRWMDKTIQLIVSENGTCGINMEHSVADGIALGHMVEHTFSVIIINTFVQQKGLEHMTPDPASKRLSISINFTETGWLVEDLDLCVYRFEGYGQDFIKSQSMSPDAFIQLSLQLTYYKIHGTLTSTYESASVRRFRLGRVDVIRANSQAALTWIRAMLGQTDNTTILGHGVDLHLLGLREAAVELGLQTPDLFTDLSYKEFNTFRLSTSQVPTVSDYWMGYGAVVPDGYGVYYNPQPDFITFCVASFFSCMDTSSDMFVNSLESSLLQMAELCTYDPNNSTIKQR
ncbi:unnamed protein product, partial [Candidula unifasciata]